MRIVGGSHKGRQLQSPKDGDIRPTTDRVREALFSRLSAHGLLQDAVVLDAFAGTGALGLEALSRGARHVTFFDISSAALKIICRNAETLDLNEAATIQRQDATSPRKSDQACDLLFLDPPYGGDLVASALAKLEAAGWISEDAAIVAEMAPDDAFAVPAFLELTDDRKYGAIRIVTMVKLTSGG